MSPEGHVAGRMCDGLGRGLGEHGPQPWAAGRTKASEAVGQSRQADAGGAARRVRGPGRQSQLGQASHRGTGMGPCTSLPSPTMPVALLQELKH